MQILKKLLKNELYSLLNMNNMFDTTKGRMKSPLLVTIGALLFGGLLMALSGMYSYLFALSLIPIGAMHILPVVMFAAGSLVVFFYGALRSSGALFNSNDYDLLMSLPIPHSTIILAKLIALYLSDLVFSSLFMLPCLGVWWYFQRPDFISLALALLCLPFIPAIPIILATIIGTTVAFLAGRSRHKSLVSILANLALVFGAMGLVTLLEKSSNPEMVIGGYTMAMQELVLAQYPPARLFFSASQGNVMGFIAFAIISMAVLAVFTFLVARVFKSIHSKLASVTMKASTAKLAYSKSGSFAALLKRELRRFLSSSVYFINCGIGALMGLGGLIYVVLFGGEYIELINATPMIYPTVLAIFPTVAGIFSSISCTSAVSVSLEGQSLWVIKQLPVSGYSVFISKIIFNLFLTVPVSLSISIAGIFMLNIRGFYALIVLIYPLIVCVFMAYAGLVVNLKFPSFNWTSETKVVKQSASMGIVTVCGMALAGVTFSLVTFVFSQENAYIAYLIAALTMSAAVFVWNGYLKKNSERILLRF
ncbi:MAG: hypothetical protein RR728_03525 [Oscillospiraceae bacterium]